MTRPPFTEPTHDAVSDMLDRGARLGGERIVSRLDAGGLGTLEFAALIMDESDAHLEEMAQAARRIRARRFGNAIKLYAPLYLSNACINACRYCGFGARRNRDVRVLTPDQAMAEGYELIRQGHRHLLLVAGENDTQLPLSAVAAVAERLRAQFASIAVEIRPYDRAGYARLAARGVDGVTLYQETYQRDVYAAMHPAGPKSDFDRRLAAIEAAGDAGMRFLSIGALLGLADWRRDAVSLAHHALFLQKRFWRAHISVSVPRLTGTPPNFSIPHPVADRDFTRLIVALRCMLPDIGIALSTRESAALRRHLTPLGITQLSAGSRTRPGAYALGERTAEQFAVKDMRTPAEVADELSTSGFDPVFKDWESCLYGMEAVHETIVDSQT